MKISSSYFADHETLISVLRSFNHETLRCLNIMLDNLPPLDAIGLEPSDQAFSMARGGSGRRASGMQTPSSRSNPIGLGFGPIGKAGMGNFAMPAGAASKLSSEERFAMASRSASSSGAGMSRAGAPPLSRTSSQGGPGGDRRRTRSSRGHARDSNRQSTIQQPPANMQPRSSTASNKSAGGSSRRGNVSG